MRAALSNDPYRIVVALCDSYGAKVKLLDINNRSIEAQHRQLVICVNVLNNISSKGKHMGELVLHGNERRVQVQRLVCFKCLPHPFHLFLRPVHLPLHSFVVYLVHLPLRSLDRKQMQEHFFVK